MRSKAKSGGRRPGRPPLIRYKPQLKPDLRPLDNVEVEKAAAALRRAKRSGHRVREAEVALVRVCEAAQEHRDWRVRTDAMYRISRLLPRGGERIAWRSLEHERHPVVVSDAIVATWTYARERGAQADLTTIRAMGELVRDRRNDAQMRRFVLQFLPQVSGRGLKAELVRTASAKAPRDIRLGANKHLLRFGYAPAKHAIVQHIRRHPERMALAYDLWRHRGALRWRRSEWQEMLDWLEAYRQQLRRRLWDDDAELKWRAAAVRWLVWLGSDGFEVTDEEIKQGRRIAKMCRPAERKQLLEMLREFGREKRVG